jgi:hypothetical protein
MALGEFFPVLAVQAGAFGQVPDFKIKQVSFDRMVHGGPLYTTPADIVNLLGATARFVFKKG